MPSPLARQPIARVALFLAGSGFCALVYETAWLRELRLVFGASTAASAAVLAIFMAGLGFGGLRLGRWADRTGSPLSLYGRLEGAIALGAGLSPWLVEVVSWSYIGLGGSAQLGALGGTLVRLLLSGVVLGVPAFLMGGTLPAAVRAVERGSDAGRRVTGMLYAINTLGAVLGTLLTTFVLIEQLGVRKTVWVSALLNVLIALGARSLAREMGQTAPAEASSSATGSGRVGGRWFVPVAAGLVGFVFLLMELVWYRMLGPLLGGSSYSFGLILAMALLGIGLGALLYGAGGERERPGLASFAGTCTLEGLVLALPLALGDRIAVLAALLRGAAALGFGALVGSWAVVAALVVLLPAVVAGYQFPLLVALSGSGTERLGRQVGRTYAANTLGSIAGSLAGGFGLLPLMTAPGVWRLCVVVLLGLGGATLWLGRASRRALWQPVVAGGLALLCLAAQGPTAFWRHAPIGAGRLNTQWNGPNDVRAKIEDVRRAITWEADGVESTVALHLEREYSFIVNGKSDGSALGDAPTQVMSGLVGALLHPDPRRALVIGLGTGSTAGWLAQVPSIERVDVVELEPVVRHVAELLGAVNRDALANPKIHLWMGDGREFLLVSRDQYDVVFSEPSNPYRAGVASLFSAEFYRAVEQRLRPGGLFLQWLQGYEVDPQLVRTAYATLGSVFPAVESWQVQNGDLLLVASRAALVHDLDRVRARVGQEPYRSAMDHTWGVDGVEGFYSAFLAGPGLAREIVDQEAGAFNTDDRPRLEFEFAKNLGRQGLFQVEELSRAAGLLRQAQPATRGVPLDGGRLAEMRVAHFAYWQGTAPPLVESNAEARARNTARRAFAEGDGAAACAAWLAQPAAPRAHVDRLLVASCLAAAGDARTPHFAALLAEREPIEADLVLARYHAQRREIAAAGESLLNAIVAYRRDPWVYRPLVEKTLPLVLELGGADRALAERFWQALSLPFAVDMFHAERLLLRFGLVALAEARPGRCAEALAPFEPHPPWEEGLLSLRAGCYRKLGLPLAATAEADLERFRSDSAPLFFRPPQAAPTAP